MISREKEVELADLIRLYIPLVGIITAKMPKHDSRTRVATLKACGFVQLIAVQSAAVGAGYFFKVMMLVTLLAALSEEGGARRKPGCFRLGPGSLMGKFEEHSPESTKRNLHSSGHL